MKARIIFSAVVAMTLSGSCQDNAWDDHYGIASNTANLNVMQILEQNDELGSFCAIVKSQRLDTLLTRDQTFTVWAPTNEAMAAYISDGNDMEHLLKNHINRFIYTASDLTDTTLVRIKMLNGKFQDYARTSDGYTFAGIKLSEAGNSADYIATNGLVRTLGTVAPFYLNIYETVNRKDNGTDSISGYLTDFDDYTFDKANSTAVGKNQYGQLVYDSAFVYTNEWMANYGSLYLEDSVYTFVMPTNAGWIAGYDAVEPYFRTFGTLESSSLSTISVPTRTYAVDDVMADSLTRAHTLEAMTANLVFRGNVNPLEADGDSLVATSGNVFHHPAELFGGSTSQTVSNGTVWRTDVWNYKPSDCFLKSIVVEAEDTKNRTDAYANVFSRSASHTAYSDSVSGQRFIEVNAATTNARTQPMVQFTIPNTLAATYDVYVVFAPAEAYVEGAAADSTRVRFYLNYVHADGKMKEDPVIDGSITNGKGMTKMKVGTFTFPFANFTDSRFMAGNGQDEDCVRLRVQADVSSSETARLTRTMRIDCIIFEPVTE